MKVVIVTNGEINDTEYLRNIIAEASMIICADGAAKHLIKIDIAPDMLVGDFDSIAEEDLKWMETRGVKLVRFPTRKDSTDTELAVDYALEQNPLEIILIGGVGSRWDHSLSNIMLLKKLLRHNVKGRIVNELNDITITQDSLELEGDIGDIVSILPVSEVVKGVNLYGLEYPLENRTIPMGSSLGISNKFKNQRAKITLEEGILLVIKAKE